MEREVEDDVPGDDPVQASLATIDRATVALQHVSRRLQTCSETREATEQNLMNLLAALEALRSAQRDCFLLTAQLSEWISSAGGTVADMDWRGEA